MLPLQSNPAWCILIWMLLFLTSHSTSGLMVTWYGHIYPEDNHVQLLHNVSLVLCKPALKDADGTSSDCTWVLFCKTMTRKDCSYLQLETGIEFSKTVVTGQASTTRSLSTASCFCSSGCWKMWPQKRVDSECGGKRKEAYNCWNQNHSLGSGEDVPVTD